MNNELIKQVELIIDEDIPLMGNLANISAVINTMGRLNWCGFYLLKEDYLYLGPFQGEVACTKIKIGKGVCGTAASLKETIIVEDVEKFPGHIRCSSASNSEIVVPIIKDNNILGVIDLDSPVYSRFTIEDKNTLEAISKVISNKLF